MDNFARVEIRNNRHTSKTTTVTLAAHARRGLIKNEVGCRDDTVPKTEKAL